MHMLTIPRLRGALIAASLLLSPALSQPVHADPPAVTDQMLLNAANESNNWLMYGRDYANTRYSPLAQINNANAGRLQHAWSFSFGVLDGQTTTPLVNNGVMYVTSSWSKLFALDAKTGEMLWRYDHPLPDDIAKYACCDVVNRGVALYGDKVYLATLDMHVVALDAKTGKVTWDTMLDNYKKAYTFTVAPLIVKGKVIVGTSNGEYPVRGFIAALDAGNGKEVWRTYTVPGPGEPGNETWGGESWKVGGGSAWVTGSYDPQLDLLYWGTGNPAPDWDADSRPGDNLYSNSALALDPDTGAIKFHFQYTPHDVWDYDGVNENILVNARGKKAWIHADRNGYLYTIDRTNGNFLAARPISEVNWGKLDASGRPIVNPAKVPTRTTKAMDVCPGPNGGKEWNPMAVSPQTGLVYIPVREVCVTDLQSLQQEPTEGEPYWGVKEIRFKKGYGKLTAVDIETGKTVWDVRMRSPIMSGVLATAGSVVFAGTPEGEFMAFDAKTGQQLYTHRIGSGIVGGVMTYAVDGKQYVAVPSGFGGWVGWTTIGGGGAPHLMTLPKGGSLHVFALSQ
jgi:alcohol dehydrogenase (cytochrome c)